MSVLSPCTFFFFFNDTATTEIYTLSLHDALPILDVRFNPEEIPEIYNALTVPLNVDGEEKELVLEVQQLLGDDMVRTVAMSSTDGLQRGVDAQDTGRPIAVPVGQNGLGRVMDALGKPVAEQGPIEDPDRKTHV